MALIINPISTYAGVADFDTGDYVSISSSNEPDFYGETKLRWQMWLDNDSGYDNMGFQFLGIPGTGYQMFLLDSCIYIATSGTYTTHFDITGFSNRILQCEVKRQGAGTYLDYFKINNVIQSGAQTA